MEEFSRIAKSTAEEKAKTMKRKKKASIAVTKEVASSEDPRTVDDGGKRGKKKKGKRGKKGNNNNNTLAEEVEVETVVGPSLCSTQWWVRVGSLRCTDFLTCLPVL